MPSSTNSTIPMKKSNILSNHVGERPVSAGEGRKENASLTTRLWKDPRFSDITILVGEKKSEYKLHRNIICQRSTFFDVACKEGTFIEGTARVIELPEINAPEFEVVVQWLYDGGYELPRNLGYSNFIPVYKAADFLGIPGLKAEMVEKFTAVLEQERGSFTERRIATPLTYLSKLTEIAPMSDWELLRPLADQSIASGFFKKHSLLQIAGGLFGNPFFTAIVLDAYQDLVRSSYCTSCLLTAYENPKGYCQMCKREAILVPK